MNAQTFAVRAKTIIPMTGESPARGAQLFASLASIDNGMLLIHDGRIVSCGKASNLSVPAGCPLRDLGPVTIIPGTINAHVHLDLSYLLGKTVFHKGFTAWLASLIPQLPKRQIPRAEILGAQNSAVKDLIHYGTRFVGNIAGSAAGTLSDLQEEAEKQALGVTHFCEWFGFGEQGNALPWPPGVSVDITTTPSLEKYAAPGGHALYSTSPVLLSMANAYCQAHGLPFTMHLAESPEETEMLTTGKGSLYELYRKTILPDSWKAPGMTPLAYAHKLGLLSPYFLAVHGTQLDAQEAQLLAMNRSALCLCPRSNSNLGVGLCDIRAFIAENLLLCLGTDGLSSNSDLDVLNEALYLRETLDTPREALIRMLTVNGSCALHLDRMYGRLEPGSPASYAILPARLAC
ncbi:MAG: amidohydrolase family protein [Desulfovibrio sp.]|nr:amidohydrolase family protein [Desulfovibrio sp.]